jgi:hypothetical protein
MSGFGLLRCFLLAPSYAALALVAGIGSTIVAEAATSVPPTPAGHRRDHQRSSTNRRET